MIVMLNPSPGQHSPFCSYLTASNSPGQPALHPIVVQTKTDGANNQELKRIFSPASDCISSCILNPKLTLSNTTNPIALPWFA